jgi:small subunit ribosomal protein S21
MIRITRRENESLEKFIKRFKKKCEKEGLTKDMRKQEYYESKGEKKLRISFFIRFCIGVCDANNFFHNLFNIFCPL